MPYESTLTRKAILIASPDTHYGPLPGAVLDVERFNDFLRSDYGGAWEEEEISILFGPSLKQVQEELAAAEDGDYVFISFSGHGEHCRSGSLNDTRLILTDSDRIFVYDLNPRNPRHLVVVDACRRVLDTQTIVKLGALDEARLGPSTNRLACRKLFDRLVLEAEEGRVVMYSCDVNQAAGETRNGGFFSRFLVQKARAVCEASSEGGVIQVPDAFEMAKQETNLRNAPQRSVLEAGRRTRHFPFAVVA
jgi:hypothetical protein